MRFPALPARLVQLVEDLRRKEDRLALVLSLLIGALVGMGTQATDVAATLDSATGVLLIPAPTVPRDEALEILQRRLGQ